MSLSKLKASAHVRAVRKFTDREKPVDAFETALQRYASGERPLHVLAFYGIGGIGKTRLLDHLVQGFRERQATDSSLERFQMARISLDALQFSDPAESLLALRKQFRLDCLPFEYALLRYWSHQNLSREEFQRRRLPSDSILFDIAAELENLTGLLAPAKLLKRLWDLGQQQFEERFGRHRETLAAIAEIPEWQVAEHLPYYLGLALEDAGERKGARFIVFLDGHETMRRRLAQATPRDSPDEWLREFVGASENGLFIIAGREFLKWSDEMPSWSAVLEQHVLGYLDTSDSDYFLRAIPVAEPEIRERIIETARGVPLYLDLCASIYLLAKSAGHEPTAEEFAIAEDQVIRRFLSHLDREQAEAVRAMALLEHFHDGLFETVLRALNIGLPITLFADFCDASYAVCHDPEHKLFKIHDNIRAYVRTTAEREVVERVVSAALAHGEGARDYASAERHAKDFAQVLHLVAEHSLDLAARDVQRVIDEGLWLVEGGRWLAVEHAAQTVLRQRVKPDAAVRLAAEFLQGVAHRRSGRLQQARECLANVTADVHLLAGARDVVSFHQAHVEHLLGNYDLAEATYRVIASRHAGSTDTYRIGLRSRRQLADVLLLRGRFRESLSLLDGIEVEVAGDPMWLAETLRFRGHIFRFNHHLTRAEEIYRRSLQLAEHVRSLSMQGKAMTNLAETLCWSAPGQAALYAARAVEVNREVSNPIEVGKALAAWAIALCQRPDQRTQAKEYAEEALATQKGVGYHGGCIGALLACGLVACTRGDRDGVATNLREMDDHIASGRVYEFLRLPLLVMLGDDNGVRTLGSRHEWLDFDRSTAFLSQFTAAAQSNDLGTSQAENLDSG